MDVDWVFFGGKLSDWLDKVVYADACIGIVQSVNPCACDTSAHLVISTSLILGELVVQDQLTHIAPLW